MLRKIHLHSIAALALAFGLVACNSGTQTESSTNTQQVQKVISACAELIIYS